MREGFQNIAEASVIGEENRIFQFHKGGNESDMLVEVSAGDEAIHFYIDGVESADTVDHAPDGNTPYLLTELEDLYFTNQEVTGVLLHPDHPPMYIEIALDGSVSGTYLPSNAVPKVDYRDANSPSQAPTLSDTYKIKFEDSTGGNDPVWIDGKRWLFKYDGKWAVGDGGNILEYKYNTTASTMTKHLNDAMSRISSLNTEGTTYVLTTTDSANHSVLISGPNAGKMMEIIPRNPDADRHVSITSDIAESQTLEAAWSYPTYVQYPDGAGNYFQCIKPNSPKVGVNDPTFPEYWTDIGSTKPDTFDWQYPDGNIWQAFAVGVFTESYSPGGRGFPTVGVIHQQRMILMANPGFTMGIFGSRINQYKDFTRGPQDDDPFFFAIDTSDTPTIKWAESQQNLIIGTSGGDYNLTAQVTLSPSDIQALKQNNARSHGSKAVTINTDIFYIEQGKEKVRATGYIRDVQAQSSKDVSLIAEHLLDARAKRIVLMQTPEVVVFILRDDGSLACISYSHEQQNAAWYEFETQGEITDIAVCYTSSTGYTPPAYDPTDVLNTMNTDEDELWVTVTYDGGTTHYIEKMPYPKRVFKAAVEPGDSFLVDQHLVNMDGWIRGTMTTGDSNVISGLGQFEGLTVACMVEDAWTGEYEVKEGIIILDAADIEDSYSGTYSVGFRYTATARTFEMAVGNNKGSALFTRRRWNRIFVKTINSALPTINGKLPPDRDPAVLMGISDIIKTGLQDVEIRDVGWGDGSLLIEQPYPYPTEILGIGGEYSSNNA